MMLPLRLSPLLRRVVRSQTTPAGDEEIKGRASRAVQPATPAHERIRGIRACRSCGPMRFRNATRGVAAALLAFPVLLCCLAASPADPERARTDPTTRSMEPDIAACVDGFLIARTWVDTMSPPPPDAPEARLTLTGVRGVSVILRHEGRIVGVGDDWPTVAGDDRMLRRAVGRALARALGDRVIGALPEAQRNAAGPKLALEIEYAGRPEALVGRTIAECALRIDPGLDGVAIRRTSDGTATWATAYPSRLLASNTAGAPEKTIAALLFELGLPAKDLPDLVRIDPVGIFRFTSLRLAQAAPDEPPSVRARGTARVRDEEVDAASVAAQAGRLLRRLAASMPRSAARDQELGGPIGEGLGLVGDYLAVADEYRPLVAPAGEQALTAWAAAALSANDAVDDELRSEAKELARILLEDLVLVAEVEDSPTASVPSMAFALCAAATLDPATPWSEACLDFLRVAQEKLVVALRAGSANDRALAALAAATTLQSELRFVPLGTLRERLDEAWNAAAPEQSIGVFPWLVLAEIRFARATGEPIVRAAEARRIAELLFSVQAGFGDRTAQDDVRGGFRLSGARRGAVTSQTLRPGLGLVALLAYPGFVPEAEVPAFRERTIALLRYVRELEVDAAESRYFRSPQRTRHGLRNALWDSDQPVAANALAILVADLALHGVFGLHAAAARGTTAHEGAPSPSVEP